MTLPDGDGVGGAEADNVAETDTELEGDRLWTAVALAEPLGDETPEAGGEMTPLALPLLVVLAACDADVKTVTL